MILKTFNLYMEKGTSKNKLIKLTNSDNKSSGSTTSVKSVQSTNPSIIQTTNNDT